MDIRATKALGLCISSAGRGSGSRLIMTKFPNWARNVSRSPPFKKGPERKNSAINKHKEEYPSSRFPSRLSRHNGALTEKQGHLVSKEKRRQEEKRGQRMREESNL